MIKLDKEFYQEIFPRVLFTVFPQVSLDHAEYAYNQVKDRFGINSLDEKSSTSRAVAVFYVFCLFYSREQDADRAYDRLFETYNDRMVIDILMSGDVVEYVQSLAEAV